MSSSHNHRLCPSVFVAALIFSVFTLTGIVSAAWVDAPNEPPAYGASGCSPFPCLEADFRPVNLSATEQTKRGPLTIDVSAILPAPPYAIRAVGDIVGNSFKDSQDQTYFIDPATTGGYAGLFNEKVGIRQRYPNASFTVNNDRANPPSYENSAKAGSIGDAIYAYANSNGAALFAEQDDSTGYAIYASGTVSHFDTRVEIGSAANPKQLCLGGVCQSTWPSAGTGTTNSITKWTAPNVIGDSIITDDGTTVSVGGNLNVTGTANTCKKISYGNSTSFQIGHNEDCNFDGIMDGDCDGNIVSDPYDSGYPRITPITGVCGSNYYVIGAINATGNFGNPGSPPQTGSLLCCKNAD